MKGIDSLRFEVNGFSLCYAGLPNYTRVFMRDSLISSLLFDDALMLRDHLAFAVQRQGKSFNPITGEEPGKIFHEFPGVDIRGLSTEYNACDTNALFLIAFKRYMDLAQDIDFLEGNKESVSAAVGYIISHLENDAFMETPRFCGAEKFALFTTYWKDAQFLGETSDPDYPVFYPLVQAMSICGLRCAAVLLGRKELFVTADGMAVRLQDFFDSKSGFFVSAVDRNGSIPSITSDTVQMLYFLEERDLPAELLLRIDDASSILKTQFGFRTLDPTIPFRVGEDSYDYQNTVWPFEQALISIGARKFNLPDVADVASRVVDHLSSAPEYLLIRGNQVEPGGCDPQLWTLAAVHYFSSMNK